MSFNYLKKKTDHYCIIYTPTSRVIDEDQDVLKIKKICNFNAVLKSISWPFPGYPSTYQVSPTENYIFIFNSQWL